jgi:hypothetical protein
MDETEGTGDTFDATAELSTTKNVTKVKNPRQQSLFRNSVALDTLDMPTTFKSQLLIFFVAFVPLSIFCCAYGGMIKGLEVYEELNKHQFYANWLSRIGWMTLFILYIFDYSHWESAVMLRIKRTVITLAFMGFSAGWVLATRDYPSAPMVMYIVFAPTTYSIFAKVYPLKLMRRSMFLRSLSVALAVSAGIWITLWAIWVVNGNPWRKTDNVDGGVQNFYRNTLGCTYAAKSCPDDTLVCETDRMGSTDGKKEGGGAFFEDGCCFQTSSTTEVEKFYKIEGNSCKAAYLLWCAPLLASAASGVACVTAGIFSTIKANQDTGGVDKRSEIALKAFTVILLLFAAVLWISASFASIGQDISNVVVVFSTAALVSTSVTVAATVGMKPLLNQIKGSSALKKADTTVKGVLKSDWLRALVVVAAGPVVPIIVFISFINQQVRLVFYKLHLDSGNFPTKKIENQAEGKLIVTRKIADHYNELKQWRWTSVLTKVVYIGLIFMVIQVGVAKMVAVFLSFLNDALKDQQLIVVIVIYVFVGLFMFLNPAIPGVPVYITGGILVTHKARCDFGGSSGAFWAGLAVACVSCWFIKMLSVVIQHKFIGERLGKRVWVRNLIGRNSDTTKGMGFILSKPGLDLAKTYILVAGPDWPTTVLTGVLGCPIGAVLVGSMFIMSLIAPTCLSAAALIYSKPCGNVPAGTTLEEDESGTIWLTVATLCLALTGVIQVGMLISSGFYIKKALTENKSEIDAMFPHDQEVEDYAKESSRRTLLFKCATQWKDAPTAIKWVIATGAFTMACSCYLVIAVPEQCFLPFEVTESISMDIADGGLGGNVFNILVTTTSPAGAAGLGHIAVGLFVVAYLCLKVFSIWAGRKVGALTKEEEDALLVENNFDATDFQRKASKPERQFSSQELDITGGKKSVEMDAFKNHSLSKEVGHAHSHKPHSHENADGTVSNPVSEDSLDVVNSQHTQQTQI